MALVAALGGRLGFGFSAGAIDAGLNMTKANTHNFALIMAIGLLYFVVYYLIFTFLIKKLNLTTPGREPEPDVDAGESPESAQAGL
jgi:PTS system N-acetylglucosamine-specific IIC component